MFSQLTACSTVGGRQHSVQNGVVLVCRDGKASWTFVEKREAMFVFVTRPDLTSET